MSETARGSVEISAARIDDEGRSWIEVMPTAEEARNGPWYFTITAEDLGALVEYVRANPDRIPIDRDHATSERGDSRAAGWFTGQAEVIPAGGENRYGEEQDRASVWAEVKWTPAAIEEIRNGEFRFVSPEWSMAKKDKKSGLMSKFKELAAVTLTNRPFFKELSAVTARDLLDSDQLDALTKTHGPKVADLVLAGLAAGDERTKNAVAALLATDNAPDGASDLGDEVKDQITKALGLAEDASDEDILAAVEAAKKPSEPENKVTDYLKVLGLDETADPTKKFNAALNEKDGQILALRQEVTDLKAKVEEGEKLNERIEDLEKRDRKRDIEVFLSRAVDQGRVLPAEKESLAELFADNVNGLKSLIATRPEGFSKVNKTPRGSGGSYDFGDDPDVTRFTADYKSADPVDPESAKLHLLALDSLKKAGKGDNYTTDEYIAAVEEARSSLVY